MAGQVLGLRTHVLCLLSFVWLVKGHQTPCNQGNDTLCLLGVRDLLKDSTMFWFGEGYEAQCPESGGRRSQECHNPAPQYKSIITRMRMKQDNETMGLEQVLSMHYSVPNGTYIACGSVYTVPATDQMIDATHTIYTNSWALRSPPHITWQSAANNALHTLVVWDAGRLQPLGMWVNKAGNNLHDTTGQELFPYRGLMNALPRKNPFVFALYTQAGQVDAAGVFRDVQQMANRDGFVSLAWIAERYNLTGPVGAAVIRIAEDSYAIDKARRMGTINNCPYQQTKDLAARGTNDSPLNFTGVTFSVSVDVTYHTQQVTYDSCCKRHEIPENTVDVDPSGQRAISAVYTRTAPLVHLQPTNLMDMFYFAQRKFTLLLFDVTNTRSSSDQTEVGLVLHWQVVNIRDPMLETGDTILSYLRPIVPLASPPSRYYAFLLLEQQNGTDLKASDLQGYAGNNCSEMVKDRCKFEMSRFTQDLKLKTVGASFFQVSPNTWSRMESYDTLHLATKAVACAGVEGYTDPCQAEPVACPASTGVASRLLGGVAAIVLSLVVALASLF